ncbi:MAG: hypothetical protein ABT940_11585 [Alphaproteobacteria bacterium]
MPPFVAMIDACFAALGENALYQPADGSPSRSVRVIVKRMDSVTVLGTTQVVAATAAIDVRIAEVPMPQVGDRVALLSGVFYVVASDPLRDPERLVWTLSTSPPALWDPSAGLGPGPVDGGGF